MTLKPWTTKDETELMECVRIAKECGDSMTDAFRAFADMRGRSVQSTSFHYYKVMKPRGVSSTDFVSPYPVVSMDKPPMVEITTGYKPTGKFADLLSGLTSEFETLEKENAKLRKENDSLRQEISTLQHEIDIYDDAMNLVRQRVANVSKPDEVAYTIENGVVERKK